MQIDIQEISLEQKLEGEKYYVAYFLWTASAGRLTVKEKNFT